MAAFDAVIVSHDSNPLYKQYIPLVRHAWERFFPEVEFVQVEIDGEDPRGGMMRRYKVAAEMGRRICMIQDADLIPLQRYFADRTTRLRRPDCLLAVGAEEYAGSQAFGNWPATYMTGEGYLFHAMLNQRTCIVNGKEDPAGDVFCDESLISALLRGSWIPVQHEPWPIPISACRLDRNGPWCKLTDLRDERYVDCHAPRPWSDHVDKMAVVCEYLEYDGPVPA